MTRSIVLVTVLALSAAVTATAASYVNFESSHVHPIALTPSGDRLLLVNTPDARLEVFTVNGDGSLTHASSIPVGLEPVSVGVRDAGEAWVVNHLSDTVSIVDLGLGTTIRTLAVGDEPADVAFAGGRAFVAVAQEDAVKVYDLADLDAAPAVVPLFSNDARALAVSPGGATVYAVPLNSGNRTTVVNANVLWDNNDGLDTGRVSALGLFNLECASPPRPYPPLPPGIARNPDLDDPSSGVPEVSLIVAWDDATNQWRDETGQDWTDCLHYRLPDHDLFRIDVATLSVVTVDHLGTSLFDVSVNPADGRIYVPHTEARNLVRFEHALGVRGHMVDNRLAVIDPAAGHAVTEIDLNTHVNRGSDPSSNLGERQASISQAGMMAWKANGSAAYMVAIGSRKLWRVDGGCLSGDCIFGPTRAAPAAVEVGEGPTGVALHEGYGRAYVLLRFSNSVAVVDTIAMAKVGEVALHDPSPATVRDGRRLLYDGIDSSGHGDAACSSCHLFGDLDLLAWDLGDPAGDMVPYSTPMDNVRFLTLGGLSCNPDTFPIPGVCSAHDGFDPQKGPMTTQTLRGMLEPLHWRGDRATMNDFNPAFVGLMGKADIGPVNGKPAGHTAADMEAFRQFALGIRFAPNPYRLVDDTLPAGEHRFGDSLWPGSPRDGEALFLAGNTDGGGPCADCHTLPFGAGGGVLGGLAPAEPTSPLAAALFNGTLDGSRHSDLKIPHMRNMYEKFGPMPGDPGGAAPDRKSGFGYTHDGAIPDLLHFLSATVFSLSSANNAEQVRDLAAFSLAFDTGTRPAIGRHVTLPAGPPPTGPAADEALLAALLSLGGRNNPGRHCELTATALTGGRVRSWSLLDGAAAGAWATDVAAEPPASTAALRAGASGPISFLCATLGSGARLGGDRDEDEVRDGDDCNAADAGAWQPATLVTGLVVGASAPTLAWDHQAPAAGPGMRYDVAGGLLSALRAGGLEATACVAGGLTSAQHDDGGAAPSLGDGAYYLVRARNPCASPGFGPGREVLAGLACPP